MTTKLISFGRGAVILSVWAQLLEFWVILPVKTGIGVSRRQPEGWFFRPKGRGEAKIALFLLFFAFWCRRDTVQNRKL
jgi:hypothetical protein